LGLGYAIVWIRVHGVGARQWWTLSGKSRKNFMIARLTLPEPESPVNQRTHPFWFMAFSLVAESTEPSCHLMLVESPTLYASTSTEAGADMATPTRLWRREAAGAMEERLLVVPVG